MIPKKIHYCWFGGKEKPKSVLKCIESWQRYCPDYEIVEWNENNFDVHSHPFTHQAYEAKKWAFVSDYARLYIVYNEGGIYLDTDVEIVKSLDPLLDNEAYIGFEGKEYVNTGSGFGAVKGHRFLYENMKAYDTESVLDEKGNFKGISCPVYTTALLKENGLCDDDGTVQSVCGVTVYPCDRFCPYDYITGVMNMTDNTYSIHMYSMTWIGKAQVIKSKITRVFHRLFGKDVFHKGKG